MLNYLVGAFEIKENGNMVEMANISSIELDQEGKDENIISFCDLDSFICHCIDRRGGNIIVYLHDLAVGGNFILNHFITDPSFTEGRRANGDLKQHRELGNREFTYTVSSRGEWYCISVKIGRKLIKFVDSKKLLPFEVSEIKKGFECDSDKEVLILHKAINEMHSRGFNNTTIGNCCLKDYYKWCVLDERERAIYMPDLNKISCPFEGFDNADEYIRKAYHGGWCYVNPKKKGKIINGGITADVNGLYSAMMHSKSGNRYPVGKPQWFTGAIPEEIINNDNRYYFVRLKTRFYLKKGYLPTVQVKGSPYYGMTEWLETSDYRGHEYIIDFDNKMVKVQPELVLTKTDYELLQKHYDLKDTEIIDGCWFNTAPDLFDNYVNKWANAKVEAKTKVDRTIAKLMLNNLSGKFATESTSTQKTFKHTSDGIIMDEQMSTSQRPGYVAIAAAITSYARAYTITAAQANYSTFLYSDTDSIHLATTSAADIKGAPEHPTELGYWKYETSWDKGLFVRQKCYVEHVTEENLKAVDPYYNFKCAGMTEGARDFLVDQLESGDLKLKDIKPGLKVNNNVKMVSVDGGVKFVDTVYTI